MPSLRADDGRCKLTNRTNLLVTSTNHNTDMEACAACFFQVIVHRLKMAEFVFIYFFISKTTSQEINADSNIFFLQKT